MPPPLLPPPPDVAGHRLDGGTLVIAADENRILCQSLGEEPARDGSAHPSYGYIATQKGMSLGVAGLCRLCDFDVNDGPMMGSCDLDLALPLRTDEPYAVRGEVLSLNRKASRKLGTMDVLEYRLQLVDTRGEIACTATNVWILPRGHAHET